MCLTYSSRSVAINLANMYVNTKTKIFFKVVNSSVWKGKVEEIILGAAGKVGVLWEGAWLSAARRAEPRRVIGESGVKPQVELGLG